MSNLLQLEQNIGICGISESKLNDRDFPNICSINGYSMLRYDRIGREGGGTLIYINNNFYFEIVEIPFKIPVEIEFNVIRLQKEYFKSIHICYCYFPPDKINEKLFEFLNNAMSWLKRTNIELLMMGDFNINLMTKDTDRSKLFSITKEFNLTQLINCPTRVACRRRKNNERITTSTLIDHVYASQPCLFSVDFTASDHKLTYAIFSHSKQKFPPKTIEFRDFKRIDMEKLVHDYEKLNWDFLKDPIQISNNASAFEQIVVGVLNNHAPIKKKIVKGKCTPWFTNDLVLLTRKRNAIKKQLTENPQLLQEY